MSAHKNDNERVKALYEQCNLALRRFAACGLTKEQLTARYEPEDPVGMQIDAIYLNVYQAVEEAANLDIGTKLAYPGYPWSDIAGMRVIMAHVYFKFDPAYLWDALQEGIPQLVGFCREYASDNGMVLE